MFVISITYIKPLSEIDRFLDEHIEYLKRQYSNGVFIVSGKKKPRTGGIIIAKSSSLEQLQTIIEQDPFYREKIASYDIVEFIPSMAFEPRIARH